MKTAVLAIILFCVMIFPHELGHFIAARKTGVRVNEFAFGMGPVIWRKQGKETLYSIRLFPVGGFCAMEGEDEDSDDPGAFNNKRPWQKIVILAAGSFMNIVCAVIIMSIVVGVLGFTSTTVGNVTEGGPAWQAHMEKGDRIVAVNGGETSDWEEVREAMIRNGAVYFAAVGGAGALLSKSILSSEVIAYDDLGTEAVRKLSVKDFPVVVVMDSQGNNLYETAIKQYCKE